MSEDGAPLPESELPEGERDRDLGWMSYAPPYAPGQEASFFRARLDDGVLEVEKLVAEGLAA